MTAASNTECHVEAIQGRKRIKKTEKKSVMLRLFKVGIYINVTGRQRYMHCSGYNRLICSKDTANAWSTAGTLQGAQSKQARQTVLACGCLEAYQQ